MNHACIQTLALSSISSDGSRNFQCHFALSIRLARLWTPTLASIRPSHGSMLKFPEDHAHETVQTNVSLTPRGPSCGLSIHVGSPLADCRDPQVSQCSLNVGSFLPANGTPPWLWYEGTMVSLLKTPCRPGGPGWRSV